MTKTKIAIVDDERAIASMYRYKLEHEGFDVRVAYDGKEGFEVINNFRPYLVLLDLRMPIMTGDAMLEKLRTTEWGSQVKVIVLTNISKDEAPASLRLLGVERYIVKAHHTPNQIVDILREIL